MGEFVSTVGVSDARSDLKVFTYYFNYSLDLSNEFSCIGYNNYLNRVNRGVDSHDSWDSERKSLATSV